MIFPFFGMIHTVSNTDNQEIEYERKLFTIQMGLGNNTVCRPLEPLFKVFLLTENFQTSLNIFNIFTFDFLAVELNVS